MTMPATHLSAFLREHLPRERKASPHTCDAYAYAFQLLVCFATDRLGVRPSQLAVEQLNVSLVLAFLEYVEAERRCSAAPATPGSQPSTRSSNSWSTDCRPALNRPERSALFR
jgi:hypothetical protein